MYIYIYIYIYTYIYIIQTPKTKDKMGVIKSVKSGINAEEKKKEKGR